MRNLRLGRISNTTIPCKFLQFLIFGHVEPDDLFISKAVVMKVKPRNGEDSDVELDDQGYKSLHPFGVFCKDCDSLVSEVLAERGLVPDDTHIHCGFDSGQGILKIAVTATNKIQDEQENRRVKYGEGVAARVCKLSSVKRMLVIGAVPQIPENYPNVKMILDELNMEAVGFTMSLDIKIYLIVTFTHGTDWKYI